MTVTSVSPSGGKQSHYTEAIKALKGINFDDEEVWAHSSIFQLASTPSGWSTSDLTDLSLAAGSELSQTSAWWCCVSRSISPVAPEVW